MNNIPYSPRLSKLLRIIIVPDDQCNYKCEYCCFWNGEKLKHSFSLLREDDYNVILDAMIDSNCRRVMLSGGEPLLLSRESLIPIVSVIAKKAKIDDFWITTNGSLLSQNLSRELLDAGLKKIAVTIAGENNQKYRLLTKSKYELDYIFKNIEDSIKIGLKIHVHVPINKLGVSNYDQLNTLIGKVSELGVRTISCFPLHKTSENAKVFDNLYLSTHSITKHLYFSKEWILKPGCEGHRWYFTNGEIRILIPPRKSMETKNCLRNKCGHYCQGSYAAYLLNTNGKTVIKSCHRDFKDDRNVFTIDPQLLYEKDRNALKKIFDDVWSYTYDKK